MFAATPVPGTGTTHLAGIIPLNSYPPAAENARPRPGPLQPRSTPPTGVPPGSLGQAMSSAGSANPGSGPDRASGSGPTPYPSDAPPTQQERLSALNTPLTSLNAEDLHRLALAWAQSQQHLSGQLMAQPLPAGPPLPQAPEQPQGAQHRDMLEDAQLDGSDVPNYDHTDMEPGNENRALNDQQMPEHADPALGFAFARHDDFSSWPRAAVEHMNSSTAHIQLHLTPVEKTALMSGFRTIIERVMTVCASAGPSAHEHTELCCCIGVRIMW